MFVLTFSRLLLSLKLLRARPASGWPRPVRGSRHPGPRLLERAGGRCRFHSEGLVPGGNAPSRDRGATGRNRPPPRLPRGRLRRARPDTQLRDVSPIPAAHLHVHRRSPRQGAAGPGRLPVRSGRSGFTIKAPAFTGDPGMLGLDSTAWACTASARGDPRVPTGVSPGPPSASLQSLPTAGEATLLLARVCDAGTAQPSLPRASVCTGLRGRRVRVLRAPGAPRTGLGSNKKTNPHTAAKARPRGHSEPNAGPGQASEARARSTRLLSCPRHPVCLSLSFSRTLPLPLVCSVHQHSWHTHKWRYIQSPKFTHAHSEDPEARVPGQTLIGQPGQVTTPFYSW